MVFKRISAWFRFHFVGIALSIFIGIIISAPPMLFRFSSEYQGVDMLKTNTEAHYVAQIKEVFDGHPSLGNPFFADLKNSPYLFPPLSPNVVAWFGKALFLSPIATVMVVRFIATTLLTLCIYLFTFSLTGGRRLPGLLAAPGVMLGYSLVDPAAWPGLFNWNLSGGEKTFIDYGRPINPQISSLFFFAYLVCLINSLKNGAKKSWLVAATIISGFTFYVYLFTWTFIGALNCSLILVAVLKKDYANTKKLILISAGMGLMGIPYFLHTITVSGQPEYAEVVLRFGFVKTHAANISRTVVGAFALFLFSYRRLAQKLQFFFSAFFIAAIVVVNEQVVTGQFIFNHHFHWYYNTPLVIILFAILTDVWTKNLSRRARLIMASLGIAVFIYNGIIFQIASYRSNLPSMRSEQRFAPVFDWLNTNSPNDSTIVASSTMSILAPALTHNNIYYPATGIYTLVSDKRLLDIFAVYAYLRGVNADTASSTFESERPLISGVVYGYTYYFQPGVCGSCFPDNVIEDLTKTYQSLNDTNFISFLKQYPADYIIWDTTNDPAWNLDRFKLNVVARLDDFVVYSLR